MIYPNFSICQEKQSYTMAASIMVQPSMRLMQQHETLQNQTKLCANTHNHTQTCLGHPLYWCPGTYLTLFVCQGHFICVRVCVCVCVCVCD